MADATDVVREAFRAELTTVLTAASITWPVKEVENEYAAAGATTKFIAIEFAGGSEQQLSTGDSGNNLWREDGTVFVRLYVPINSGKSPVEGYASSIRTAFRDRRFNRTDGRQIAAKSGPPDTYTDGVRWISSVAIAYRTQNAG